MLRSKSACGILLALTLKIIGFKIKVWRENEQSDARIKY